MRLDIPGIEAFLAVAQRGSFRRAAAAINLSQAALSHRLKKLEEALGTTLLARTTRRVALTDAGLELLPIAERAVGDMEHVMQRLRDQGRQGPERIAIGCLPTLALLHLPSALADFARLHPSVRVQVFDNSAAEIEHRVRSRQIDFGITFVSARALDPALEMLPLARDGFVLVCPHNHPMAGRTSVQWRDLEGEPLIRISAEAANRALIDNALGRRREDMFWRFEVQRVPTALGMVATGLGVAVLPQSGLAAHQVAGLVGVQIRNPAVARGIGILSMRDQPLSVLASDLAKLVTDRFAASAKGRRRGRCDLDGPATVSDRA